MKRYTVGPFSKGPLAEARKKAREPARMASDGTDPMAERQRARRPAKLTFQRLADRYLDVHAPTLREYTRYTYRKVIDSELLPASGNLPASSDSCLAASSAQ